MRLAVLGGGGFRVPLVYGALLRDTGDKPRVEEVVLYDVSPDRLEAIRHVLARARRRARRPARGADHHRPGRRAARRRLRLLRRSASAAWRAASPTSGSRWTSACSARRRPGPAASPTACAPSRSPCGSPSGWPPSRPQAWVINFTNPAGMVTEAMRRVLGDRVIGICDSPIGLVRRAAAALGARPGARVARLRGAQPPRLAARAHLQGRDVLPGLLADDAALAPGRGGPLFGADWVRDAGRAAQRVPVLLLLHPGVRRRHLRPAPVASPCCGQQDRFYAAVRARPGCRPSAAWRRRAQRARRDVHGGDPRDHRRRRARRRRPGGGRLRRHRARA